VLFKAVTFVVLGLPLARFAVAFTQALTQGYAPLLGVNPVQASIHYLGLWALRLLLLGLALRPLARLAHWPLVMSVRRMVGLFAFSYICVHLLVFFLFDLELSFADLGRELVKRPYILVGMAAFALLVPLAITSTNGWIRRLGAHRWQRLHRLVYAAGMLAAIHFIMERKGNQIEPKLYLIALLVLLGWRLLDHARRNDGLARARSAG